MVRIFLFVIIIFCALVGFSFGETSYFDQNGNPVSREEYEKISKKFANNPPARPPDTAQVKPKLVTTEQKQPVPPTKQPIPPIKQTQSESQEAIRKKILDTYSKIPPIVYKPGSQDTYSAPDEIYPLKLQIGQSYIVSKQTPLVPSPNPANPRLAIHQIRYIPIGCGFKIHETKTDKNYPWYKVTALNQNAENIGSGWINSIALIRQHLKLYE